MVKCDKCGQTLIDEELSTHVCDPPTRNYETKYMTFYNISKDRCGNDLLIVKSVDGTLYSFTKLEHPSPEVKQPS